MTGMSRPRGPASHAEDANGGAAPSGVTVSVVIVNYRAYVEVGQCLASLEAFRGDDIEVILVDHATSPAEADALAGAFPWVRVLAVRANPGFAAGVNRAAAIARGRYLLLLNPDSLVQTDVCRTLARWMDGAPEVGAVGPRILDTDGTIQGSARRFPDLTTALGGRTTFLTRLLPGNRLSRRNLLVGNHVREPRAVDWVSGACVMVRHDAFRTVGGMDEGFFLYWEDADLCARLAQRGWTTVYHPLVHVTHACGVSSAHAARASLVAFHESAYRYYWKHGGRTARLFAPLVYVGLQARLRLKLARLGLGRGRPVGPGA
jgi:N-acetylglucosaminyl-diphospho-decaprenol L-rhamnosyltransferase